MKQNLKKNILDRFSCSLVGGEKKIFGHKTLLYSLFLLRGNNNFTPLFTERAILKDQPKKGKILKQSNLSNSNSNVAPQSLTFSLQSSQKTKNAGFLTEQQDKKEKVVQQKKKAILQLVSLPSILFFKRNENQNAYLYLPSVLKQNFENKYKKEKEELGRLHSLLSKQKDTQKLQESGEKNNAEEKSKQEKRKVNNERFAITNRLGESICLHSIENVKPVLETRKIRKGRVTYKVPKVTSSQRQEGKAISLLIENANSRKKLDSRRLASSTTEIEVSPYTPNRSTFPLLFSQQITMRTSISKPLNESNFLILPSCFKFSKFSMTKGKNEKQVDLKRSFRLDSRDGKIAGARARAPTVQTVQTMQTGHTSTHTHKGRLVDKSKFLMISEKKNFDLKTRKQSINYCLAESILESINGKGEGVEKKKRLHQFALQNRAYQHFRWW